MIIGIDCSSKVGGLAIDDESYFELEYVEDIPQKLKDLGVNPKYIKNILLTIGPGSFTGLRVGLSIAQGISIPHQIPILGYSTFLVMVAGAPMGNLLPILHARKDFVYVAHFEKTDFETREIFTNRIMKIDELLDYIKKIKDEPIIFGAGADLNKKIFENNNYKVYKSNPIAPILIELYKNNAPYTLNPGTPFYLSVSEVYRKRERAEITLRPMKLEDIDGVIKIEKDLFPEPWDEDAFYLSIMMNNYISVVGTIKDKIISYMIGRPEGNNFHLMNIAVSRKFWKKGYGSKMISYLLKELEKNKLIKSCYLEHRITNKAAFEMYKKFGFKVVGIRPNYYGNKIDAVIMEINI
jgi:ribosomal-protein-alanine N-acetyltransferase